MKKLLLAGVAVGSLALASAPAHAELEVNLGGYFKGYGAFVDQDDDIVRDTELHVGGETTLDNGLTVGVQVELEVDGPDGAGVDESYAYFSGNWGRVNFGSEDGAAYLLQVAAPSADDNYDGLRQYVSPFVSSGNSLGSNIDYDADPTAKADKLTYLSPVFSGFQVGVSFSPDTTEADSFNVGTESAGVDETYELAARYEGQFNQVGVIAGAGYTHGENNDTAASADDRNTWNVGLDLDIGAFGVGAAYLNDNNALDDNDSETDTYVLGVDYTTGPFKIGASYLNQDTDTGSEFDRYTGGVVYEYGPGMSFRGSISHLTEETSSIDDDGTTVLLGTQVNF
jgi:outer membrane protein OmpU